MPAKPLSLQDTMITCLTDMTGRKADEARQVMIPKINVDVPKKSLIIFLAAFLPAAFFALVIVGILHFSWLAGLGGFALVQGIAFYLFQRTTREGLQVRTFTEMRDKQRPIHTLMVGGVEVDPSGGAPGTIVAASVPVARDRDQEFLEGLGVAEPSVSSNPKSKPKKRKAKPQHRKSDAALADAIFGKAS